jgi:hypothetical protein
MELFDDARGLVAEALLAAGTALTVAEQRMTMVPNEEGTGFRSEYVVVETNALKVMARTSVAPALRSWLDQARTVATAAPGARPICSRNSTTSGGSVVLSAAPAAEGNDQLGRLGSEARQATHG